MEIPTVSQGKWLQWHQGCASMLFRHMLCAQALECFTSLFRPRLQGRSQAFEVLRNDWEYPLRNAWKYQQYRKASGYSGIKAALRCSSATYLANKPLDASLCSFVHDCKDEVKLLMRCAMIGNIRHAMHGSISYAMHRSTNSIARQVATVASRLRFDALPPHTLRTSPWMLHFALSSVDCKDEIKHFMRCAMIGNIRYIII